MARSRRDVDELTVPQLQHEQRPQPLGVIRAAGGVLVQHRGDRFGAEHAAVAADRVQQHVAGVAAKVPAQPLRHRGLEAALRGVQNLVGQPSAHRPAQRYLLLPPRDFQPLWKRRGELHQLVIQQRRASFQRGRHRRDVDLREQVVGQECDRVDLQLAVDRAGRGPLVPDGAEGDIDSRLAECRGELGRVQTLAPQPL